MTGTLARTPRTMLVTGATGFIGSRLATLAQARGYTVRTLTRSEWTTAPAVPIGHRFLGSLPHRIPAAALDGVDVVVHCAAAMDGSDRAAWAVNVDGTRRLAELGRGAGVDTFIFVSSQSARADAESAYGRTKYAAERELLPLTGLRVVILRPGLVTGPSRRGIFHRMCRMVDSLPVLPLLGGGRALVQPIHVDDLCEAVFRCDAAAAALDRSILHLGDPEGVPLAELLRRLALARRGRARRAVSIPLEPVELAVGVAEALRIPLPVTTNNLKGLKRAAPMETAGDLARLGLSLRSIDEAIQDDVEEPAAPSLEARAVRVLLIGAGRAGLIHAVTLSRLSGAVLCGVVDLDARATGLLRGMGVSAPAFKSLDEALARTEPDAVVIATPASSHLPLARRAVTHGLAVLVEKPLAITRAELGEYERLAVEHPRRPIQVGYVMPKNPHVAGAVERLRAGRYGRVLGFAGVTLISAFQEAGTRRWEAKREVSGGGALINSGGHVLSTIRAAFGDPEAVRVQHARLYSKDVEDSLIATLTYPGFGGTHYCSWSMGGFSRQENRLTVWTDEGRLLLTSSLAAFVGRDGAVEVSHQLDFDVGFNLAPDYLGSGFTTELTELRNVARGGVAASPDLDAAIGLERLLFDIYDASSETAAFSPGRFAEVPRPEVGLRLAGARPPASAGRAPARILDLRELSSARVAAYLGARGHESSWDGFLLAPSHAPALPLAMAGGEQIRVTVPDFLAQSRLIVMGRYGEVLKEMGARGVLGAVTAALPSLGRERAPTFWVAALALLGAALRAVPAGFRGTLLLSGYLTDFALSLGRLDMLEAMVRACRRAHPHARVGFHTNMAVDALDALARLDARVDEVSVLTSPHAREVAGALAEMRRGLGGLRLMAEVGLAPGVIHRLACAMPHGWTFGADAILVGPAADPELAADRQAALEREWEKVFPGAGWPGEEVVG